MNEQDIESDFTRNVYDSRDIRFLDSKFQTIWPKFKEDFGLETGFQLEICCVWRSIKAQNDIYQYGRTKPGPIRTRCDGYKTVSNHQIFPSKAIDVYIAIAKKPIWEVEYYKLLEPFCEKYQLNWGGSWVDFKDWGHIEFLQ